MLGYLRTPPPPTSLVGLSGVPVTGALKGGGVWKRGSTAARWCMTSDSWCSLWSATLISATALICPLEPTAARLSFCTHSKIRGLQSCLYKACSVPTSDSEMATLCHPSCRCL